MAVSIYVAIRLLGIWCGGVLLVLPFIIDKSNPYFRIGINDDLVILSVVINTWGKYCGLVLYSVVNSAIRSMNNNVVSPWLINNIQHEFTKTEPNIRISHMATFAHTFYYWLDWFIYINLLLAQIDLLAIETFCDICVNMVINYKYTRMQREPLLFDVDVA